MLGGRRGGGSAGTELECETGPSPGLIFSSPPPNAPYLRPPGVGVSGGASFRKRRGEKEEAGEGSWEDSALLTPPPSTALVEHLEHTRAKGDQKHLSEPQCPPQQKEGALRAQCIEDG